MRPPSSLTAPGRAAHLSPAGMLYATVAVVVLGGGSDARELRCVRRRLFPVEVESLVDDVLERWTGFTGGC